MRIEPPLDDPLDPAARARRGVILRRRRYRCLRLTAAFAFLVAAMGLPFVAHSLAGGGAAVGATVAALLLMGLAVVVLPYTWSAEERSHRELEAIWRQVRPDAVEEVPWNQYAAWAQADGGVVELSLIRRAPAEARRGGVPSPYERETVQRVDPQDMMSAAGAMEDLRAQAAARESAARERHKDGEVRAERLAHERVLASIDEAAAADLDAREAALRRELAEREVAEREAQASALARALRRP